VTSEDFSIELFCWVDDQTCPICEGHYTLFPSFNTENEKRTATVTAHTPGSTPAPIQGAACGRDI